VTRHARAGLLVLGIAIACVRASDAATVESSATLDPFGRVDIYRESPHPARVVLLLSDADGWNRR
jgi:hypothetical protein